MNREQVLGVMRLEVENSVAVLNEAQSPEEVERFCSADSEPNIKMRDALSWLQQLYMLNEHNISYIANCAGLNESETSKLETILLAVVSGELKP